MAIKLMNGDGDDSDGGDGDDDHDDDDDDDDDWLYLCIDLIGEVVNGGSTWIRVECKSNVQRLPLLLEKQNKIQ